MKNIQDQLKTFLIDHHYYEVAIPLITQFSKSYDLYYKKLTEASDYYLKQKGDALHYIENQYTSYDLTIKR